MARALATACLLAILAASALADRVQLNDGRSFTGIVTVEGDSVQIVMEYGTIRVPRSEVTSIEMGDTPEMELARKLSGIPADNPGALCDVAKWAAQNNLPRQAEELFRRVLRMDGENAVARAALDYAKVEGEWRTFSQGLELARNKLEAGQFQALLGDVLPPLESLAHTKERQVALGELAAMAQLRSGKIAAAAKAFEDLCARAAPPAATRYAAIAEVLKENPDGMSVLAEPYPPGGELLGGNQPAVKAGPASLTDPRVLQAALADRAKKDIQVARDLLDEMRKSADAETVKAKGAQAAKSLNRADALAPGIARSYRVELVRLRIESIRREIDQQAKDFDKESATLGKVELPVPAYRAKVQKLISLLDVIRENLKEIVEISKPFPRDLLLDVKWAELDLRKNKEMRDVLTGELDVRK
jgi:hypothetical protein